MTDSTEDWTPAEADAERRAEVQHAVSRVLTAAPTVDDAVAALLPSLSEALQWQYAGFWLVNEDRTHIACTATWTVDHPDVARFAAASRGRRFEHGEGLPGRCWAEAQAIWLSGVQGHVNLPRVEEARAARLFGALAFPVMNQLGVAGVIEFFTWHRESVTPALLQLTESIGHQVGQFLQRRSAEERLADNEARYSAIVKGALDAIIVIDQTGHVSEFNPAAERLFGYARSDAIGRELAELIIPEELRDAHRAGLRRHEQSGQSAIIERRIELIACRRDGTRFPVELTISRMRLHGGWSFLGFMRDITDRVRYEREREELVANERTAREEAVAANVLKDEFLAALSHELRTPLNAVLGWSEMLVRGAAAPERVPKIAATIKRNAELQHRLVDDMLDLSAFIAGRVRLSAERLDVVKAVQAAAEIVRPAAEAKRLNLRISVPPAPVCGDSARLQQVFWNLLTNAIKFTPSGGTIDVHGTVENDSVSVAVTDSGRGIEPSFIPHVFERFRQAPESREEGGLGLGLAIAKQIVEAHGGTITASSKGVGKGATFTVDLPLDA